MANQNDGGPAFPQNLPDDFVWRLPGNPGGMSLRDWFAGQAMVGWLAGAGNTDIDMATRRICALNCYELADAMLKERDGVDGEK
jgi:hypothetical protein